MINTLLRTAGLVSVLALSACDGSITESQGSTSGGHNENIDREPLKGPHNGRLLIDEDFSLELSIFETGVPPEFRVWITDAGVPVDPRDVELEVTLERLGDVRDDIRFEGQKDFLRGDMEVYEPHSFMVTVNARYHDQSYQWSYENFEGRTRIDPPIATAFGLETEIAGEAVIRETVTVYGRIEPDPERQRIVTARFDGVIQSVHVSAGGYVKKGQRLVTIESNESLNNYRITAPINGVVTHRIANPGEQTAGRQLFTILDNTSVWVKLAVFPADRMRVSKGARVTVGGPAGDSIREGVIERLNKTAEVNQSVLAIVVLDNADGAMLPGTYVNAEIEVAQHPVPLAVKRSGLQGFRDFTVVFAQVGDQYEVRMLELGRQDAVWVEVLSGLEAGSKYVTTNSYLVKADIEKSGASHDH
jgi:cobalt-zinc-cadmium efflux system membrane fusion protein